ncbi:lysophospholipase L1-like esterase [Bacillus ectoiniformans]|uniref:SGNH/GDSL hydrolase family protein n=1 Tax=Bacillus ectoiniformans TaxID=1494429 RepID=UPI001EF79B1A|nr:GDSL-type esterase/lipase family protein [Bacillus ectoiniformans]MBM7648254.1 lysophospholipase L1-like esterase [Bacillus ectoiniformans]
MIIKKVAASVFAAILIIISTAPAASASSGINYLALGDSLAAGQTPNREIGASYTDLIALALGQSGSLENFSKQFAIPGYTTGQVLEQLKKKEVQKAVKQADLMTISAGANDLLRIVKNDSVRGILTYDAIPAAYSLNKVRENYVLLFEQLNQLNPNADIYAMGYYFPYPHVHDQHKPSVNEQLQILNQIIQQEAERAGATFVPVADSFGTSAKQLIPNPKDVHPSSSGYLEMANSFLAVYRPGGMKIPASALDQLPPPVSFSKLRELQPQTSSENETEAEIEADETEEGQENTAEPEEVSQSSQQAPLRACSKQEVLAMN